MKLALLLYGHLRTYKQCYLNLHKFFLNQHNVDVFIHTWDETEAKTISWHSDHMPVSRTNENEIVQIYKPTQLRIEHQPETPHDKTSRGTNISSRGQQFMLYSLHASNELKRQYEIDNNFKYDAIVKIRPDILLNSNLPIKPVKHNQVLIAGNKKTPLFSNRVYDYQACDIINISSSDNMNTICDVYNHFHKFYEQPPPKEIIHHSPFVNFMMYNKLQLDMLNYKYNVDWTIRRA